MTNDKPRFGATGKFPQGKMGPHDEGEVKFGIAHDEQGNVHFDFGTPVHSFVLPQASAINFARMILKHCGVKKVEIEL